MKFQTEIDAWHGSVFAWPVYLQPTVQHGLLFWFLFSGTRIFWIPLCVCVLIAQSCPTFCDPVDCGPPGSSTHGILQSGILEWVAIPFSRRSSWPRDWTWVFCIAGRFLLSLGLPGKPLITVGTETSVILLGTVLRKPCNNTLANQGDSMIQWF